MNKFSCSQIEQGHLFHIKGNNALSPLDALSLQVPEKLFHYSPLDNMGFVAKLGQSEFLLYRDNEESWDDWPDSVSDPQTYVFPRDDALFTLNGENWSEFMLQVCSFDFSKSTPGEFILANMAGVSTWFRVPSSDEPLVFGCDPSYGHYLYSTMQEILAS